MFATESKMIIQEQTKNLPCAPYGNTGLQLGRLASSWGRQWQRFALLNSKYSTVSQPHGPGDYLIASTACGAEVQVGTQPPVKFRPRTGETEERSPIAAVRSSFCPVLPGKD